MSAVAAALRPRSNGGAVIGVERGFALEDADGTLTPLAEVWTDDSVRMNEGGCDPDGRFYCGSMAYDQQPGRRVALPARLRPLRARGAGGSHGVQRARVEPGRLARLLQRHRDPSGRRLRLRPRGRADRAAAFADTRRAVPTG